MRGCARQGKEGVFIDIHVVPGSKKESTDYDEYTKRLRLKIKAPAVDGKANREVLSVFSSLFGDSEIVSGVTSRKKTILVRKAGLQAVLEGLEGLVGKR